MHGDARLYADELVKILEHWGSPGADRVTVVHYDDEIGNQNFTVERIMKTAGECRQREGVFITPRSTPGHRRGDQERPAVIVATISTARPPSRCGAAAKRPNVTSLSFVGPSQLAKAAGADAAVSYGVVPPPTKKVVPVISECGDA